MRKGDVIGIVLSMAVLTLFVTMYFIPTMRMVHHQTYVWKQDCKNAGGDPTFLSGELHCIKPNSILDIPLRDVE